MIILRVHPFIQAIEAAGGQIFQVGGAVRDEVMGLQSKDLDLVVRLLPAPQLMELLSQFGKVKEQMVGGTFAMIKFIPNGTNDEIDIALPRTERKVAEGYQGFEINADHLLPLEADLERRDFTINSIAKDLDGNIIDPFGGMQDIRDKIIKITNPIAFQDDPLRMLRAVQFVSRFPGFTLDWATYNMICENAKAISEISAERVVIEFEKIVSKGDPAKGAKWLVETKLFREIFLYSPNTDMEEIGRSTNMAEFIYTMLRKSCAHPSGVWTTVLKGDKKETYRLLKAFETVQGRKVDNEFDRRKWVFDISKYEPHAIQSFVVRDTFDLGKTIDLMRELRLPFMLRHLALHGDDIMELGVPEGRLIFEAQQLMLDAIYHNVTSNTRELLTDVVKNPGYYRNLIQQTRECFT